MARKRNSWLQWALWRMFSNFVLQANGTSRNSIPEKILAFIFHLLVQAVAGWRLGVMAFLFRASGTVETLVFRSPLLSSIITLVNFRFINSQ
ncbi:hypothetical protein BDV37DRAFT_243962 [Aspergillus pseudonomiae]|uniref:Uncharacterized protein n=1 Tax=Aspergillus pseudonomiae TaxID=1506151 RepID=A0A5N7DHZ0_9EURO|nr:uncharacterized protein BDV37DRAFT_243962 [Aspergillus pseudonomiae]KAE8406076.1 hypothetical protein BDV37DRAFT_243962 [Aspergillus pseudonomiae]